MRRPLLRTWALLVALSSAATSARARPVVAVPAPPVVVPAPPVMVPAPTPPGYVPAPTPPGYVPVPAPYVAPRPVVLAPAYPPPARYRYRPSWRGLRAGGGLSLAFGLYALLGGAIVYGLAAGHKICGVPGKPACDTALSASYGLFGSGGILVAGGITMLVLGRVFRYAGVARGPRVWPTLALLPGPQGGLESGTVGIRLSF